MIVKYFQSYLTTASFSDFKSLRVVKFVLLPSNNPVLVSVVLVTKELMVDELAFAVLNVKIPLAPPVVAVLAMASVQESHLLCCPISSWYHSIILQIDLPSVI